MLWCLVEKSSLNLVLKKEIFLTKFQFYLKRSMEISGKGFLHFCQETSSLIGNQTYHRTNMIPTLATIWTMHVCICIMINGKTCTVPLNILSRRTIRWQ